MATNMKISNAAALAMCNALVDLLDAGAGVAKIEIRSGSQPADVDTTATGTVLATINLPNPAFGNASDQNPNARASLLGVPLSDSSADNTGTASWFRAYDRNGTGIIDGTVGTSSADMILDNVSINAGQQVTINSWQITVPE